MYGLCANQKTACTDHVQIMRAHVRTVGERESACMDCVQTQQVGISSRAGHVVLIPQKQLKVWPSQRNPGCVSPASHVLPLDPLCYSGLTHRQQVLD